jgi:hypothetical protein
LFDNPVGGFSLEELAETARALERERFGRTELSRAVFSELAMKRRDAPPSSAAKPSGWPGPESRVPRSPARVGRQHIRSQELGAQRRVRARQR